VTSKHRNDSNIYRSFVFLNIGLFLTNKFSLNKLISRNFSLKFRFKKLYYSFVYPDKLKRSVMTLKKRIIVSRFFKKYRLKSRSYRWFKVKNAQQYFNSYYNSLVSYKYLKTEEGLITSLMGSTITTLLNVYKDDFVRKGYDYTFKFNEIAIPRIRFKPGYQRMWRRARLALQEIINTKFRYQHRLTRYLMRCSESTKGFFYHIKKQRFVKL
jgi:hypothetical protein